MFSVQKVVQAYKSNMNFNDKSNHYKRLPRGYVPKDLRDPKDASKKFDTILDSILERETKKN